MLLVVTTLINTVVDTGCWWPDYVLFKSYKGHVEYFFKIPCPIMDHNRYLSRKSIQPFIHALIHSLNKHLQACVMYGALWEKSGICQWASDTPTF